MVVADYLERDVAVGGLRLHYQEWGNPANPTILMVHGFGVSGHMFDEFAQLAQDRYHLIAIDQRGHGDSDWSSEGDYSRDAFVGDLEGFRQALGIEECILMGHSMGGLNAVVYANRYPQRVRALILVDVGPEAAKEGVDNIMRFTRGPDELDFEEFVEMAHRFNPRRTLENIRERMGHRLRPTETGKWTWKFDKRFREPNGSLRVGSELSNDEMWQLFRAVRVPTLLVRGSESDVLTQETAERVVSEMPNTRLVLVPGAGHSVPGDNPDDFTEAVETFLSDLDSERFEPGAADEPPPLEQLVEENGAAARRPGMGTLVLVGVGAAVALAGVAFAVQQTRKRRRDSRRAALANRARVPAVHLPAGQVLVHDAGERARDLAAVAVASGRRGAAAARRAAGEVDWHAARENAAEWAGLVGEEARTAARKVDRKQLRKRQAKARRRLATAFSVLRGATVPVAAFLIAGSRGKKRRRRIAPWRG